MSLTNTLPSPMDPVRAAWVMALLAASTSSSATTVSIFALGTKSTVYSAPR